MTRVVGSFCGNSTPHHQHTWPNEGNTSRLCLGFPHTFEPGAGWMPDQTGVSDGCGVFGVPVHREEHGGNMGYDYFEYDPSIYVGTPGRWFPTNAQALAEMRERLVALLDEAGYMPDEQSDTVLRALGLDDRPTGGLS